MASSADVAADPALVRDGDSMSEKTKRDGWDVLFVEEGS